MVLVLSSDIDHSILFPSDNSIPDDNLVEDLDECGVKNMPGST